jgi:predicted nucleic acid-binding Zn ribbon protein
MKKCINCIWEGDQAKGPLEHCPVCGDNTTGEAVIKSEEISLDLNKDGKVDKKDVKLASKVMNAFKKKKSRKSRKR